MARPFKRRHICCLPECQSFRSCDKRENDSQIVMTVDEYECIRLMDYEHMTQEECAKRMKVARTTVQSIYETARYKLAAFLVDGSPLLISGGHYEVCEAETGSCGCSCPREGRNPSFSQGSNDQQ